MFNLKDALILNLLILLKLIKLNFKNKKAKIINNMKIYLLLASILFLTSAHTCKQVGSSSLATLSACVISTPPPQFKWSINITLLEDYDWRGPEEIKYYYMKLND